MLEIDTPRAQKANPPRLSNLPLRSLQRGDVGLELWGGRNVCCRSGNLVKTVCTFHVGNQDQHFCADLSNTFICATFFSRCTLPKREGFDRYLPCTYILILLAGIKDVVTQVHSKRRIINGSSTII